MNRIRCEGEKWEENRKWIQYEHESYNFSHIVTCCSYYRGPLHRKTKNAIENCIIFHFLSEAAKQQTIYYINLNLNLVLWNSYLFNLNNVMITLWFLFSVLQIIFLQFVLLLFVRYAVKNKNHLFTRFIYCSDFGYSFCWSIGYILLGNWIKMKQLLWERKIKLSIWRA